MLKMSPESFTAHSITEALHHMRNRTQSLNEGVRTLQAKEPLDKDTFRKMADRMWRIPVQTTEDGTEDFDSTWFALKRRRFEMEVLFTPQIANLFLQKMAESETGLFHSTTGVYDSVTLGHAVSIGELDRLPDSQIGRQLASLSSDLWLWALQEWQRNQQDRIIEKGLQNRDLDTLGYITLLKMTEYFNSNTDKLRESDDPRARRITSDLHPWMLFQNGATHGNKEMWRFLDVVSRKAQTSSLEETREIAGASYPTLAFLATFHDSISEPLSVFLSENPGTWQMDIQKFEIDDRRKRKQLIMTEDAWKSFLQRFIPAEELEGEKSAAYALPLYQATTNGELLGCPFFQAPGQQEVQVSSSEAPEQFVTPLAIYQTYLNLATRFIFQRHHS